MQTGMINTDTTTQVNSSTSTQAASGTLDKNAFLQLLVAQLKNQDPTNAQDPNQMVQQMAQFSALEQQQNTYALLNSMQTQISAMFQGQSANLIGKNVQVTSNAMNLAGGQGSIGVNLPAAANVVVSILDATGRTVAVLNQGAMPAGNQVVTWNGQDSTGNMLPDGTYTASISAVGLDGKPVAATTTSFATVTAVSFSNGTITITAGGQQYPLSAVNEISA